MSNWIKWAIAGIAGLIVVVTISTMYQNMVEVGQEDRDAASELRDLID